MLQLQYTPHNPIDNLISSKIHQAIERKEREKVKPGTKCPGLIITGLNGTETTAEFVRKLLELRVFKCTAFQQLLHVNVASLETFHMQKYNIFR